MAPPAGTFLAKVRAGAIQFPPPLRAYCNSQEWDLFQVLPGDPDRLVLEPVLDSDLAEGYFSSLTDDGRLWIPADVRKSVSLLEQSVMMRIENGAIGVYLRKVFDTLGFRP